MVTYKRRAVLPQYTPGQTVVLTVQHHEAGGYSVLIENEPRATFLPTQALLLEGEMIEARFVCIHQDQILVTPKFKNGAKACLAQGHQITVDIGQVQSHLERGEVEKAFKLLCSHPDNEHCQYQLGHMYEEGLGVDADHTKAFECYLKAARSSGLNAIDAQEQVARCYSLGLGIAPDPKAAQYWQEKASHERKQLRDYISFVECVE
jgi:TPR repeat protein